MSSEATESLGFIEFQGWLETHKKKLITWGIVAAVLILAVALIINHQNQKEVRASEALSNVRTPLSPGAKTPEGTVESYLEVARKYAGTKAGARALVLAGSTLFAQEKYADAQKQFEQLIKEYPESPWITQALFGLASSLDAQKQYGEALAKFEELRKRYPNDPIVEESKLAMGRIYETQGKHEDAYKMYDELTKAGPSSGIGAEANMRQEDLVEKHPELAKLKAPPVVPPPVMISGLTNRPATNRTITLTNLMQRTNLIQRTNAMTSMATNRPATNQPLVVKPVVTPVQTNKP